MWHISACRYSPGPRFPFLLSSDFFFVDLQTEQDQKTQALQNEMKQRADMLDRITKGHNEVVANAVTDHRRIIKVTRTPNFLSHDDDFFLFFLKVVHLGGMQTIF